MLSRPTLLVRGQNNERVSLIAAIAVGISYLGISMRYSLPLGDDGIIYMWPAGFWLSRLPWREGWKLLIASFMTEDHLSPVHYLLGYLFYKLPLDPVLSLKVAAKLFYLTYVILTARVVYEIWEDKNRVLLFFSFLVVNLGMTWRNMVLPSFTIPAGAIWAAFIFYVRYLKRKSKKDFFLFSVLFLLATFSFETSFVGFPLFLIFSALYGADSHVDWSMRVRRFVKHSFWLACLFLAYLTIHFYVYGSFLPGSRLGAFVHGNPLSYYLRVLFSIFSEWLFDIPKGLIRGVVGWQKWEDSVSTSGLPLGVYTGFGLLVSVMLLLSGVMFLWSCVRFRLIRGKGWLLWTALTVQIVLILITGRYEDGMWIICGLTFWMAMTDIVYYSIKEKTRIPFFVLGILAVGILVNAFVNPFDQARKKYHNVYETSMAAYEAIDENTDRIKVVRLKGSETLIRSSAFWIGNKIYHRHPGLWFYPQQLLLYPRNMYMEFYPNLQNHSFDFFRSYMKASPDNKETLLFQDSASFFRVYLNADDRRVLRVVPISALDKEPRIDIYLPELNQYHFQFQRLRYVLAFKPGGIVQKIHYAGGLVSDWHFLDEQKVEFYNTSTTGGNLLVEGTHIRLKNIEVFIDGETKLETTRPQQPATKTFMNHQYVCTYSASSSDGDWIVWGSADPQEAVRVNPLWAEKFRLIYQRAHPNQVLRQLGQKTFDPQTDETVSVMDMCDSVS